MNKIQISHLIVLILISNSSMQAQIVSKAVYEQYTPSIVAKVYQFARQVNLDEQQQLKMAAYFQQSDSLLVENLKQGKPVKEIDYVNYSVYSNIYLAAYLDKIKSVKKVPENILEKIRQQFYRKARQNLFADWGSVLMEATQVALPDTSIFASLYKSLIKKQEVTLSATERLNLIGIHHISKDEFVPIVKLIEEKAYQQALIEYTYAAYSRKRDSLLVLTNHYNDSLIKAALLRNGSLVNSSQFAIALKYKQALELDPALTEPLLFHAMYVGQQKDSILQKDPFAKTDFKAYEARWLNEMLTEDQYTKLLSIKNSSQARMDATDDWNDLEERGVATEFDKKNTINQLYNYYMQKWNAYYRYANNNIKQEANLQVLKDNSPKALKVLNAAKKQPNPVNTNTGLNLKW